MNMEFDALEQNRTWDIESLPSGKNVVGCRWVFTINYNSVCTVSVTNRGWLLRVLLNRKVWILWILSLLLRS